MTHIKRPIKWLSNGPIKRPIKVVYLIKVIFIHLKYHLINVLVICYYLGF